METRIARFTKLTAWLPLAVLPGAALLVAFEWTPWMFMWAFAFSMLAGLKWLRFADSADAATSTVGKSLGFLLLWPGMDAKAFFASPGGVERPSRREWLWAVAKVALGLVLVAVAVQLVDQQKMIAGWIGMTGIVFTLHFGLFHLLSVAWRRAGVDAAPIMNAPLLALSLSDFWSRRWNLAFRDLSHTYIFRPCVGRMGIAGATMVVFLVSGIVHDAVISLPARGGWGLPTLYFVIQGVGLLFERSRVGKRIGTRKGVVARLFCAATLLGPVFLLFHPPFMDRVVAPMLLDIGRMWR